MKEGDTFIDCVSGQERVYNDHSARIKRVVYEISKNGKLKLGYTIERLPFSINFNYIDLARTASYIAVSRDVFNEENLIWDPKNNTHIYSKDKDNIKNYVNRSNAYYSNPGHYQYVQDYSATTNLKIFTEQAITCQSTFSKELKSLIPYTFGVEHESSMGTIPQDECLKYGLIPLRDGSISGIEYASIILDPAQDGFEKLQKHVKLLDKYTRNNRECSTHIHFGNIPLKLSFVYGVYQVCCRLQSEIARLLPRLAFRTAEFKNSGKDYCKPLPNINGIREFYRYFTDSEYFGSLNQGHPRDIEGRHKWNINTRYYFVNFVNALCYNKGKTIELRCLAPTTNFNKLVGWIFLFSGILKYVENKCAGLAECEEADIPKTLSLTTVLSEVYPPFIVEKLMRFMLDMKKLRVEQEKTDDYCGENSALDNMFFQECILS